MEREEEADLLRKEKCGRAGEQKPEVEDIVARIWKMKLVPIQLFGVRHKFLCLISKMARHCIQFVIMLQLINPAAK